MSISTKCGDNGQTSLFSGEKVFKDDIRIEAYGTIDELDSVLSEAKHYVKRQDIKKIINLISKHLSRIITELSDTKGIFKNVITIDELELITNYVYSFENETKINAIVMLGSNIQSAKLDMARSICRRAERRIVSLGKEAEIDSVVLKYINRLSDLLFMMARVEEKEENCITYL